ncbi:MAG: TRAP transporter small permease [Hydrogenophilus thermoluteolus]
MSRIFTVIEQILAGFSLLGMFFLGCAIAVTLADIFLRLLTDHAISGTVDMVEWCVVTTASWSIPHAFFKKRHVVIDIATQSLAPRTRSRLDALASLVSTLFVTLVGVYAIPSALLAQKYGDSSQTLGIPLFWYWLPFLIGMGLSVLACVVTALQHMLTKHENLQTND